MNNSIKKEKNYEEEFEKLKNSPLFNLSLGSKEHFHSNFLDWLAKNYRAEMGELFSQYLKDKPGNLEITKSSREEGNIDLKFEFNNNQELLIENKVKSIPILDQLKEYSTKNLRKNYLLLCLIKPTFEDAEWNVLTYKELAEMLKRLQDKIPEIPEEKNYHKILLKDYISFIESLNEISSFLEVKDKDKFPSLYSGEVYEKFKEIRLYDLYLKAKYGLLAFKIYSQLKSDFPEKEIFFNKKISKEAPIEKEKIYVGSGIEKGKGQVSVTYYFEVSPPQEKLGLGIHIDGNKYNRCITGDNVSKVKEIADELKSNKSNKWFDSSRIKQDYNITLQLKENGEFYEFGKGRWLYITGTISNDMRIKELVECVVEDVKEMLGLKNKVLNCLKEN